MEKLFDVDLSGTKFAPQFESRNWNLTLEWTLWCMFWLKVAPGQSFLRVTHKSFVTKLVIWMKKISPRWSSTKVSSICMKFSVLKDFCKAVDLSCLVNSIKNILEKLLFSWDTSVENFSHFPTWVFFPRKKLRRFYLPPKKSSVGVPFEIATKSTNAALWNSMQLNKNTVRYQAETVEYN